MTQPEKLRFQIDLLRTVDGYDTPMLNLIEDLLNLIEYKKQMGFTDEKKDDNGQPS